MAHLHLPMGLQVKSKPESQIEFAKKTSLKNEKR